MNDLKMGDQVIWFQGRHPGTMIPACYVDTAGGTVRIKVQDKNGQFRIVRVSRESIEKVKEV